MKNNTTSVDKMIKNFDKELRNILLTDLKMVRVAGKAIAKKINNLNAAKPQLSVA
jgi:hypothetical protein